jgi:predicted RNA-binding protein with PIN domain
VSARLSFETAASADNALMATVLVDGENVRRSLWPNLSHERLAELARLWGDAKGHDVVVVWETDESADDTIAREVAAWEPPIWVVTSDRELRRRVEPFADRVVGGGSFARELQRR